MQYEVQFNVALFPADQYRDYNQVVLEIEKDEEIVYPYLCDEKILSYFVPYPNNDTQCKLEYHGNQTFHLYFTSSKDYSLNEIIHIVYGSKYDTNKVFEIEGKTYIVYVSVFAYYVV